MATLCCKASALVLLALAVQLGQGGAQTEDCTARFGPGCSQCETVTITRDWGKGSGYHSSYNRDDGGDSSYSSYGRQDRGGRWDNSWRYGRRLQHRKGRRNYDRAGSYNSTRLVCTACGTGYKLATRDGQTYGSCRCAPGWGVVPLKSPEAPRWDHWGSNYSCVDCSLENKVPLGRSSNLKLWWDGSAWSLVLAETVSSWWGDHDWHNGWRWQDVRAPYCTGQCVSCPAGSAPNADFTRCDASSGGSIAPSPSPDVPEASPSPAPPATPSPPPSPPPSSSPSPSPPSSPLGACITTPADDIAMLEGLISDTCSTDPEGSLSLDVFLWAEDPNLSIVWMSTDLPIMTVTGYGDSTESLAECSTMAEHAEETVTVSWMVNDTGITCSPTSGTFEFTVPSWTSGAASARKQPVQSVELVDATAAGGAAVIHTDTPGITAVPMTLPSPGKVVRRVGSGLRGVAGRDNRLASAAATEAAPQGTAKP